MRFISNIRIGYIRNLVYVLLAFILIVLFAFPGTAAQAQTGSIAVSSEPYPVGDLQIVREDITTQSFRLHVKNLQLIPRDGNRVQTQTYFLAGLRGRTPALEVESTEYAYIVNGTETTTTMEEPAQVRQSVARIADLGMLRQYWIYTLTITTMSPQAAEGYWVLKDVSMTIDLGTPSADQAPWVADRWDSDFGEPRLGPALLINPNVDSRFYAIDYGDPVETWRAWTASASAAAEAGNLFRFSTFGGGLYRLSPQDIQNATSASVAVPPTQWRVYHNGSEVPLLEDPVAPDKAVYLPIAPSDTDGLKETVYWLNTAASGEEAGPARLSASSDVVSSVPLLATSEGVLRLQHREFNDFNPKLKAGPGNDRWFWADVNAGSPAAVEIVLPEHFSPDAESSVQLTIRYGFTNFPPVQPQLLVHTRGHEAVGTTLTTQQGSASLQVPASMFKPGRNELGLRLDYPTSPAEPRPVVVQDIITEWRQSLVAANGGNYSFRPAEGSSTAPVLLKFATGIPREVVVLAYHDIEPVLLASYNGSINVPAGSYSTFQVADTGAPDMVYALEQIKQPFPLEEVESAQSVIIAAPELMEGAEALRQSQLERGFDSIVLSSRKLFDTFAYGSSDPTAIRNALRYMFYQAPGAPPQYVTLVGEASDFRGDPRLVPPSVQRNMIPSSAANTPESPQGDQQYAAAIGPDQVLDFIVGRISASEASQVLDYVAKAAEYGAGDAGEWSRITEFAMDDNDEFPDVVKRIVEGGMAPPAHTSLLRQWDYEYVPNLRVQGKKRSWTATEELLERFNRGIGVLNFFGHGGPNLWSHERLLHLSDMPRINNPSQVPLITCASCDNAWITYPMPPVKASMGELMVLKRDGGAIGLFGPVAGASPYEHSTLVQSLMEGISRVQVRRIGDAIFYAKNRYYGITRSASIPEQYLLLGDPTVDLRMPRTVPRLHVSDTDLRAGKDIGVRIGLLDAAAVNTSGVLTLTLSSGQAITSATVSAGQKQWKMLLPSDFVGGAVLASLELHTQDGVELAGTAVRVMPPLSGEAESGIEVVDSVGEAYQIIGVNATTDSGAGTAATYQFQLRSTTGTTTPVNVVALHDGARVGEAYSVQPDLQGNSANLTIPVRSFSTVEGETAAITLQVLPMEDTNAEPLATAHVKVPVKPLPDLAFVPGSARVYTKTGEFVSGATIFLEAELQNVGLRPAENFTLQALQDDPTTGTELRTLNDSTGMKVESLEPGESRKVAFRWENSSRGSHSEIYLVANRNKVVSERNHENNKIELPPFEVKNVGNFFVSDLQVSPPYAVPGTPVTVTAHLGNDHQLNQRPVTVEVGWERSFDSKTTSTKFPVTLTDGKSSFTREIIAPEAFTNVFVEINSDREIEESNPGDNSTRTVNMIVYNMPMFEAEFPLDDSFKWGRAYNLDNVFEGQLQVATEFTSKTELLIVDQENVMDGEATRADDPADDKWWVAPWRVGAGKSEAPGELGLRLPLENIVHDIPGRLYGYFLPLNGSAAPLEVKFHGSEGWVKPTPFGELGNRPGFYFGKTTTKNRALEWYLRKTGDQEVILEYLLFYPKAVQWDSPPYLVPEESRSKRLVIKMGIGSTERWNSVYIDRRTGVSDGTGGIVWGDWSSANNSIEAAVFTEEYLQIRLLGVPKDGEHPYLENVRISR